MESPVVSCLLFLLLGLCWKAAAQVQCVPNCICLVPIGTYCTQPNQDLSGFTHNLMTIEPGTFSEAGFVRNLSLSNNEPLTLQSGSFEGLTNIVNLDLSSNMITSLPDGLFSSMTQLVSLDLSRNSLPTLNPEAFRGLNSLQVLNLQNNLLSVFEANDLLSLLPSLNSIQLSGNRFDCGDSRVSELYSALTGPTLNVSDRMFVVCSNGSSVVDLDLGPTSSSSILMATATTLIASSTVAMSTLATSVVTGGGSTSATPTTRVARPTPTPAATSTPGPTPTPTLAVTPTPTLTATPTPASRFCEEETTLTRAGYLFWPRTALNSEITATCPHGTTAVARRSCMGSGVWSLPVEDQECSGGSATEQLLADISSSAVTESNSEGLSTQLASLSPRSPLSLQELDTVTDLAAALVQAGGANVLVLNNTLQALDSVLGVSTSTLSGEQGSGISHRIRDIVDSILLDALSINKTQLVLSFSHLAVGGAYLPATNSTRLLASIRVLTNGSVAIDVGGGAGQGDVMVEANGNSTVQVTVYSSDDLFTDTQCFDPVTLMPINGSTRGEVVTPIISVTDRNITSGSEADNEEVTFTFSRTPHGLVEGEVYECVRWNSSVNCGGGGWTGKDCSLRTTPTGSYQCRCLHQGTYALLDIPAELAATKVPPRDNLAVVSRVVFYILSTVTLPLYLVLIITIAVTRHLRCLPLMQCLLNQALSQGLTYLVLAVSFQREEVLGLCFTLGAALQYLYLVSLSWMAAHPVLVCIRIFRRLLYEKDCWLESDISPHALTYVTAATVLGVVSMLSICLLLLCCSDYAVEVPTYLRLSSCYLNTLLFTGIVLAQYFTAAAPRFGVNRYHILPSVGGCVLLCGSTFFLTNALLSSKIRNLIVCREDTTKRKTASGYTGHKSCRHSPTESAQSSAQSTPTSARRNFLRRSKGDSHTHVKGAMLRAPQGRPGRPISMNPVPLSLFSNVVLHHGRVRRSGNVGGVGVTGGNPAYRLDLTSSAV